MSSSRSARHVCITAVDEKIGLSIANLILDEEGLGKGITSVTGLTLRPSSAEAAKVMKLGEKIVEHIPGREESLVNKLNKIACDTLCLVPPACKDRLDPTMELIRAAKKAGISNVLLISSAGAEHATKEKQPRLHEFIELEHASPCIIRAGFYIEDILLFSRIQKKQGKRLLPLPIGQNDRFAPVAFTNVCVVAAHIVAALARDDYDGRYRDQILVVTGPMLCSGTDLALFVSQSSKALRLGHRAEYMEVSESEAKRIVKPNDGVDPTEWEETREYYSLVREGKMNFSTTTFHDVVGTHPTQPYHSLGHVSSLALHYQEES